MEDMEIATQFEIKISKETDKFREILLKSKEVNNATVTRSVSESSTITSGVKVPKIFIKRFSGDPLQWQQFENTFDATITKNENVTLKNLRICEDISDIEKFTYLRGSDIEKFTYL